MSLSSSIALHGGVSLCRNALNYSSSSSSLALFHSKLSLKSLNLNHRTKPSFCYSDNNSSSSSSSIETTTPVVLTTPMLKKRKRYRKLYPGENEGITQEMRFVAMKLRNNRGKYYHKSDSEDESGEEGEEEFVNGGGETWVPSIEGFVKFLVDCKLVFDTLERIVDESSDVSEKLLEGKELEFCRWEGDALELLKGVREKMNMLGEIYS
ncbi:hypothetical protein RJ641_029102 [Dillenia turbinata]|uniref:Uncharacterized protein n=1 Tax=Dillenia turbinata TaxID=194707 RepID=A0AAN8ZIV9_9MAGN